VSFEEEFESMWIAAMSGGVWRVRESGERESEGEAATELLMGDINGD